MLAICNFGSGIVFVNFVTFLFSGLEVGDCLGCVAWEWVECSLYYNWWAGIGRDGEGIHEVVMTGGSVFFGVLKKRVREGGSC